MALLMSVMTEPLYTVRGSGIFRKLTVRETPTKIRSRVYINKSYLHILFWILHFVNIIRCENCIYIQFHALIFKISISLTQKETSVFKYYLFIMKITHSTLIILIRCSHRTYTCILSWFLFLASFAMIK